MNSEELLLVQGLIDQLTSALSSMGTVVWEAYLKQAIYSGYASIAVGGGILVLGTFVFLIVLYALYTDPTETAGDKAGYAILLLIVYLVVMFIPILEVKSGVLHVLNPEYYAIQDIIDTLK